MTWDEDSVLEAADTVGYGGVLWILHLAGNTDVGIGKTSDYHTEESSVRSHAKTLGLDEPDIPTIKRGYKNITRKVVVDSDGSSDSINNAHKNHLVSLTSLGKNLMKAVDNDDRIKNSLRASIGVEVDEPPEPWWPGEGPRDSFAVYLHTYEDRSVLEEDECEIEACASFECDRCNEEIESEFELTLQNGNIVQGWGRVIEVKCENCGQAWEHSAADPHQKPTPP